MKLLILLNTHWESLPKKVLELKSWFSPCVNLQIDTKEVSLKDIPFVSYNQYDESSLGINTRWYDENITSLATGYEIVLFCVEVNQWPEFNKARGWRSDSDEGPIELSIAADENEETFLHGSSIGSTFFLEARHEICHALYMITGQKDNTHLYDDEGNLEKALKELDFKGRNSLIFLIQQKLKVLISLFIKMNQIQKIAEAIKIEEGWYTGSRSYRNNNPGNLKYTSYTVSLGAIGADSDNFSRFINAESGMNALIQLIKDAKNGLLKAYKGEMTLQQFFAVYAPQRNGNNPGLYSYHVSQRTGLDQSIQLKNLV